MPEQIHTKFGAAAELFKDPVSATQPVSKKVVTAQNPNGVKRLRDGSPKASPTLSSTTGPKSNGSIQKLEADSKDVIVNQALGSKLVNGKTKITKSSGVNGSSHKPSVQQTEYRTHTGSKTATTGQPYAAVPNSQALSKRAAQLRITREKLPIWSTQNNIKYALLENDILLLNGETGSGKSTQVPQFLCTQKWCRKQKVTIETKDGEKKDVSVGGMIAITQPRRIAAISLAHRVAEEMGCSLGSKDTPSPVGYSVRFDNRPGYKIKYVTEGILLQEMLHDPHLRKYSAIIVDEIHERSVDVDLIAGFLRTILHGDKKGRGGVPLKVVVMSATLDLGGIEAFFAKPKTQPDYVPGNNHGKLLAPHLLEKDVDDEVVESRRMSSSSLSSSSSWGGCSDSSSEAAVVAPTKTPTTKSSEKDVENESEDRESTSGDPSPNGVAVEYVPGRQYEVETFYETAPVSDYLQRMLQAVLQIHVTEPMPGDILAFLTGQDEIESLQAELEAYAGKFAKGVPKMKIMPLYGSLHRQAQQEAFEKVKEKGTRKVVLATNIAETSVTVSGVRYVIDCGKSKVKQYRPRLGMESLLSKPISRVSAIQRSGRAGREAKGKCFRLYTEDDFTKLDLDETPEILRSDVIEAVLKMKARGVENVMTFPLMDSPKKLAMEKALIQLHTMGAINDNTDLTDIGKKMASYPLPASYSRVLIAAAEPESDVLLEAIDVIACLTTDSEVFLQPRSEEERESTTDARSDITAREGDIITLLNTMKRYAATELSEQKDWCRAHSIASRAMLMAMQIRRQLRNLCHQQGLLKEKPESGSVPFETTTPDRTTALIKSFLKAFAFKTALLGPDGGYVTTQGRNPISIHPSSVLYGRKFEAIMFLEHVFTAKNYAKRVSAIEAGWIEEALI